MPQKSKFGHVVMAPPAPKPTFQPFVEESDQLPTMWVEWVDRYCQIFSLRYTVKRKWKIIDTLVLLTSPGLRARSTQRWTRFYRHVSRAERKLPWRDSRRVTCSSSRPSPPRSRACTAKNCCSAAPPSSALKNCVPNAISKRWSKNELPPVLQADLFVNCFVFQISTTCMNVQLLCRMLSFCKYFVDGDTVTRKRLKGW